MNKKDFLKNLEDALSMSLEKDTINEQINYYDKYISDEINKGRTEKEVLDELGDPRLIAKTIKTVSGNNVISDTSDKTSSDSQDNSYNNQRQSSYSGTYGSNGNAGRGRYYGYVNNTGTIGCVIAGLVIFIIIYGILRMFGYMAYGLGSLAVSGPIGFMLVLLLFWFLFGGGRRM